MSTSSKIVGGIVLVILIGVAASAWYFTRPPSAPSQDIETAAEQFAASSAPVAPAEESTPSLTDIALSVYQIAPDGATATFMIDEVLRGEDFTVVGTTREVAGEFMLENDDVTKPSFGTMTVNARTLQTDNTNRDGAIARAILRSESPDNEFIVFEPSIVEVEDGAASDEEVPVLISGNLTVSGVTQPVTFIGTLQRTGADEVTGFAEAEVLYEDFELTIPEVPFVASVADEVILTIDFVAQRAE